MIRVETRRGVSRMTSSSPGGWLARHAGNKFEECGRGGTVGNGRACFLCAKLAERCAQVVVVGLGPEFGSQLSSVTACAALCANLRGSANSAPRGQTASETMTGNMQSIQPCLRARHPHYYTRYNR